MIFISYPILVGSFKVFFFLIYFFQLNYIDNYIEYIIILYVHISNVLNKREKGVVLSRRTVMKFWTLC